jgi:hypothetical protein
MIELPTGRLFFREIPSGSILILAAIMKLEETEINQMDPLVL